MRVVINKEILFSPKAKDTFMEVVNMVRMFSTVQRLRRPFWRLVIG
jgi:hypothetical protein